MVGWRLRLWRRRRRRGTPFLHDVEQFCYVIRAFAVLLQQFVDFFPTLSGLGLEFSRKHSTIQIEQPVKPVLFRHCLPACHRGMSAIKSPAPSTSAQLSSTLSRHSDTLPKIIDMQPTRERHVVRGMASGRASAIGLPSAPASRSKLPRWRWRMLSATRSRPPTGAAICSRSAGNWPKPGRGIVHEPSRTVRSLPYLPQRGEVDEPDAFDA